MVIGKYRFKLILMFFLQTIITLAVRSAVPEYRFPFAPWLNVSLLAALSVSVLFALLMALWVQYDLSRFEIIRQLVKISDKDLDKQQRDFEKQKDELYEKQTQLDRQESQLSLQKEQLRQQELRIADQEREIDLYKQELKQQASREKRRLENILKTVPDGVVTVTSDRKIGYWSEGAASITRYNELNTNPNRPYSTIMVFTDENGLPVSAGKTPVEECFESGVASERSDLYLKRLDGTHVPVEVKTAPLFDDNRENLSAVVVSFSDVTAKKEIEKLKEDFLAMVTHDLKSPLAAIVGYTKLLLHPKADFPKEEQTDFLTSILGSVKILQFLIDNILESARLESGKLLYQFENFELETLMKEIEIMFTPLVGGKKITLRLEGSPLWVYGDREKIREVLNNLVSNAVKFTAEGGTVSILFRREDDHVLIRVSDTGKGIPSEELPKLFRKFVQVKGEKKGTGLGLYIVKKLLADHGREITAESVYGEGTAFTFTLAAGTPYEEGCAAQSLNTAARQKVLIVEDNHEVSNLIRYYLKGAGCETLQAFTGKEALEQARRERPDLMTLDYNLPDMNGRELIKRLETEGRPRFPVILITGNMPSSRDFYDSRLDKPLDEKRFLSEVSKLLNSCENFTRQADSGK